MKKMKTTTILPPWCTGANWLRGLIPLLALFVLSLPVQALAQGSQAPNCSNFSPAIDSDGNAEVGAKDFTTNSSSAQYPVTVTVYNQWGGELPGWPKTFDDPDTTVIWPVCDYLGKKLSFSVENKVGKCNLGWVDLNGTPAAKLTSAWKDSDTRPHVSENKMVVYCGEVPAPSSHRPTVQSPCGGRTTGLKTQPDWVMMPDNSNCGENDTAEIIWRTWEVFDASGNLTTMVDTIVVIRLPELTPDAFVGNISDSVFCDLKQIGTAGYDEIRYNAWKQATGIHDYELPYTKLGALIYDLPESIVEMGCDAARDCDRESEYKRQVILKKANGTNVTIGQILNGNYWSSLNFTSEQWNYPSLQEILANGTVSNACSSGYYPYLFLEVGDQVLSEEGVFETVTEEWFYNGHGQSPFWFSGGWPFVCGGGECFSFCDVHGREGTTCIRIRVPLLTADLEAETAFLDTCQEICIPEGKHCGIIIEGYDEEEAKGDCPSWTGGHVKVTQTCWAATASTCEGEDSGIVTENNRYDNNGDGTIDKQTFDLYHKTYHVDNIPPIFEFCYPTAESTEGCDGEPLYWNADEIEQAVRDGEQYNSAWRWERCNPTIYTTGSHDCAADIFVPDIKVTDNCSGLHQVKAWIKVGGSQRMIELKETGKETMQIGGGDVCTVYTYSHLTDPIRVPFNGCDGELIEVFYEAADDCWNQSTWSKFIQIRDESRPTVITNRDVNVTLNADVSYVPVASYDEGSWDNCAIDLKLARRVDWFADTACVNLCEDFSSAPVTWSDILTALGVKPAHATAAINGAVVGVNSFNNDYNLSKLQNFLDRGEVEQHYFNEITKLWNENGNCGKKVVHGWLFDLARIIAEDCSVPDNLGNTLNPLDLERIFDNLFGTPGYGNEMAYMGGGWVTMVPFKCGDACGSVPSELLVMDYCCNWNIGGTETYVYDKSQARVSKKLPDLAISCEAYNLFYKEIADEAAAFNADGGSDAEGAREAYNRLDEAFGKYIATRVDNNGRPIDINGNLLDPEELQFDYKNVSCAEESETVDYPVTDHDGNVRTESKVVKTTVLDTVDLTSDHGIISISCSGTYNQDIWIDLDGCGQGEIIRRFFIRSGCDKDSDHITEIWQTITVESACAMRESMFDLPGQVGSSENPICLPKGLTEDYIPDTIGAMVVKDHLLGKLCNSIAIGPKVTERKVSGKEPLLQYEIVWSAVDWCCAHTSPDREYSYTQKVMAVIDPECSVDTDNGEEEGTGLIRGTIATSAGDPVQKVEMKAVLGSGSPMTTVTGGDGAYSFSLNEGWQVSLIPQKNNGFANGVSTQDLVEIQRHILQKKTLVDKYKLIAADVNGNGGVDAFDISELRRLILQPDKYRFTNNNSWRFFDKQTDKEVFDVSDLKGDVTVDWVGVKVGDVNMSGDASRSSRSVTGSLSLNMADRALKAGESYRLDVTSDNFVDINGMQYTLSYLSTLVEIESLEPGALNISKDNYLKYAPGVITSSWHDADGISLNSDEVLFTIVLKAKSSVQLRDALSLSNRVTPTEAYDAKGGLKDVNLRFDGADNGFALYQNTPNPYSGQTVIGFKLPEASKVTLSVYDVTGKVLKVISGEYGEGYNEVKLGSNELNTTGVLYYQLDTKTYSATKKMIVIE